MLKHTAQLAVCMASLFFAGFVHAEPRVASGAESGSSDDTESNGDGSGSGTVSGVPPLLKPHERWAAAFAGEIDALYVRGGTTTVRGSDHDASGGFGFTVGTQAWLTWSSEYFHLHGDYDMNIGGGGNGLEGALEDNILVGARLPIDRNFGPFVRVGAGGEYRGDNSFLIAHLDLPKGQVGAVFTGEGFSFEAGLDGAIALGGRYITGDDSRRVLDGAPTWGGFAEAHVWPVILHGEYRAFVQSHDTPVPEEWKARACAVFPILKYSAAAPFLVCFDGTWVDGGVFLPGATAATESRVATWGISIGLGAALSTNKETSHPSKDQETPKKEAPKPIAPNASPLDANDLRRLTDEAMSHFGGSRAAQDFFAARPAPVAVVMPFTSRTTPAISDDALNAVRTAVENELLQSQAATLVDRAATDKLVADAGGYGESPRAIARSLHARYAFYGSIAPRAPGADNNSFTLTVRAMDVDADTIVWQQTADLTKVVQGK